LAAVLSVPLSAGAESLGALKVYSRVRDAFDERDQQLLTMCAAQAAILLANVRTAEQTKQLSHGLTDTMRSRDLVNIAKGILMSEQNVDEQTAFGALVSRAQVQHRTVEEIASALVTSTAGRGH
jgi:GAF domain-containing protein